jgi:hypothetical protein
MAQYVPRGEFSPAGQLHFYLTFFEQDPGKGRRKETGSAMEWHSDYRGVPFGHPGELSLSQNPDYPFWVIASATFRIFNIYAQHTYSTGCICPYHSNVQILGDRR